MKRKVMSVQLSPPQPVLLQTARQTEQPGHSAAGQPLGSTISAGVSPVAVAPLLHTDNRHT